MKTLRFQLPVLARGDEEAFLDIVTDVPGVMAALVDEESAWLDVVVSSDACAMLVKQEVVCALLVGSHAVEA